MYLRSRFPDGVSQFGTVAAGRDGKAAQSDFEPAGGYPISTERFELCARYVSGSRRRVGDLPGIPGRAGRACGVFWRRD
ncbi:hypothetical protein D3C74_291130 [compost metagenome]